jgi:hypothetical protein
MMAPVDLKFYRKLTSVATILQCKKLTNWGSIPDRSKTLCFLGTTSTQPPFWGTKLPEHEADPSTQANAELKKKCLELYLN